MISGKRSAFHTALNLDLIPVLESTVVCLPPGGEVIGHVDGGQNGGVSVTLLHNGTMRPLTHRHTQSARAFVVMIANNARMPRR